MDPSSSTEFIAHPVKPSRFGAAAGGDAARLPAPPPPRLFDLNPTEEQAMTKETLAKFADEVIRPAAFEFDEKVEVPREILNQVHELGIAHLAIAESFGGMAESRSPVSSVLVAEELSRGDMGIALAAMAPLAVVNALVDYGNGAQQGRYLPAFAGESFVPAAMALMEKKPLFDSLRLETKARQDGDGYVIAGEKSMVPLGETAEVFLVAANLEGKGPRLFIVDGGTEGLEVRASRQMGLRAAGLCDLKLNDVRLSGDALLGGDDFDFNKILAGSRIAWGAMAVGTCQAVVDYTVDYCNERIAFGEPITNRQSVAFNLADMALELDGMRLLVYRAAGLCEQQKDVLEQSWLVKLQCADKGMKIGTDGVQMLGGHGFIREHPVERWYRHLRAIDVVEGGLLV